MENKLCIKSNWCKAHLSVDYDNGNYECIESNECNDFIPNNKIKEIRFKDSVESSEYWIKFALALIITFLFSIVWFMIGMNGFVLGFGMVIIMYTSFSIVATVYHAFYRKRYREKK